MDSINRELPPSGALNQSQIAAELEIVYSPSAPFWLSNPKAYELAEITQGTALWISDFYGKSAHPKIIFNVGRGKIFGGSYPYGLEKTVSSLGPAYGVDKTGTFKLYGVDAEIYSFNGYENTYTYAISFKGDFPPDIEGKSMVMRFGSISWNATFQRPYNGYVSCRVSNTDARSIANTMADNYRNDVTISLEIL